MKIAAGFLLLVMGMILGLMEVVAILDPVGTKMTDDGDPFGDPHVPWTVHASYFAVIAACFAGAAHLLRPLWKD